VQGVQLVVKRLLDLWHLDKASVDSIEEWQGQVHPLRDWDSELGSLVDQEKPLIEVAEGIHWELVQADMSYPGREVVEEEGPAVDLVVVVASDAEEDHVALVVVVEEQVLELLVHLDLPLCHQRDC
jgi:hypothetical protein